MRAGCDDVSAAPTSPRSCAPTLPYFSIIIPVFNRAGTIARALDSCFAQSDQDFEILVVDDGSTDRSDVVVQRYAGAQLTLLRHDCNRGPCPARNTAIAHARGHWCVMLDSDFELKPGALATLRARAAFAPSDVVNLASSCEWDDGTVSPAPSTPGRPLAYEEYLRWVAGLRVSEYLNCVRRDVLQYVHYPNSRAWESEFHLALARAGRLDISTETLVMVHTDAPNRLTAAAGAVARSRVRDDAADKLASFELVLREHGAALAEHAPDEYRRMLVRVAQHAFLAGRRGYGVRATARALRANPRAPLVWAMLGIGLAGPAASAWATVRRRTAGGGR